MPVVFGLRVSLLLLDAHAHHYFVESSGTFAWKVHLYSYKRQIKTNQDDFGGFTSKNNHEKITIISKNLLIFNSYTKTKSDKLK